MLYARVCVVVHVCMCVSTMTPARRRWILRKKKSKRSSKKNMVNLFVGCFIGLLAKTFMAGRCEPSHSTPEPPHESPPPPPPLLPVPPPPPTRRSGYSRARFDANFKTARRSSRTKRKRDQSPPARRMLLSWSSSESSPEKNLSPPKRTSDDFLPLLGVFEIEDECGTWTFEEYSSNRKGGATFVVKLNGSPLLGDFGRFDKASFSHDLTRCKDETVKLDRFQLPGHLRYKGYGPKILKHLLSLYKEAGCLKIVVPSPTPSGTKCYEKVGFTRNALKTLEMNFRHGASSATESAQDLPARASSEAQDPSDDESRHSHAGCSTEVSSDEYVESFSDSFDSHDDEADDGNISLAQDLEQRTTGVSITGYTVPVQGLQRRSNSLMALTIRFAP